MNAVPRCLDCAAALYIDPGSGDLVDVWSQRICSASYRPHVADISYPQVRTTEPGARANDAQDRLRRADHSTGPGLTGVDCPASRTLRAANGPPKNGRLLDTGHPATRVADGPCGQAERNTASRTSGPTTTNLTKGIHR
jgi:hypothetical protein